MSIHIQGKHTSGFTVDVLEPFTFPAGEAHIKGFENLVLDDYEYLIADIRGHDPQDLFHLAMVSEGLLSACQASSTVKSIDLYVLMPYLPAARSDRGIPEGAAVYSYFLDALVEPTAVISLDPHSPRMPSLISGHREFPFERIIKNEIAHKADKLNVDHPYDGVIAPDRGAMSRAERAAEVLHVPVFTAGKTRDFNTGALAGFHMETPLPETGRFLIVDDICDGGGTFIGLAEAIRETNPDVKLDLWVTHGVFSKGLRELSSHFGKIHTTNSFTDRKKLFDQHVYDHDVYELTNEGELVEIHDITPYLYNEVARIHQELNHD